MRHFLIGSSAILLASLSPLGCSEDDDALQYIDQRCGNQVIEDPEVCDGTTSDEYCADDCLTSGGFCGDGIVETEFGEECDVIQSSSAEGGAGGASDGERNKGCKSCSAARGYLCNIDTNICQQTGVDGDEKAADHIAEVCTWFIGLSGGEEATFRCEGEAEGEIYTLTTGTQEDCEDDYELNDDCTIDELESWARTKSLCELYSDESPCDL